MQVLAIIATLMFLAAAFFTIVRSVAVRLGSWARSYHLLAKRYGAKVNFSRGRPRLAFNYGTSYCVLKNSKSRFRGHNQTQLQIKWPDRKLKLFISSLGAPTGMVTSWMLKPVEIEFIEADYELSVFCNRPELAKQFVTPTTQWQIRQLMDHAGKSGVEIFIHMGQLKISKLGFIKDSVLLDDFVRFGLDLFDQFKLSINNDIEFVSEDAAVVISEVTCPICSEPIQETMVSCIRCKTPHCADCWEYNGQCATFACNETRFFRASNSSVNAST